MRNLIIVSFAAILVSSPGHAEPAQTRSFFVALQDDETEIILNHGPLTLIASCDYADDPLYTLPIIRMSLDLVGAVPWRVLQYGETEPVSPGDRIPLFLHDTAIAEDDYRTPDISAFGSAPSVFSAHDIGITALGTDGSWLAIPGDLVTFARVGPDHHCLIAGIVHLQKVDLD